MNKPTFTMLVGLPGSGKSTYAKELSERTGAVIVGSDTIREELYGSSEIQGDKNKVFRIANNRIQKELQSENDVIFDATNISSRKRKNMLLNIKNIDCIKICVVFVTPLKECFENLKHRERKVPTSDVTRMLKSWETPYWFEGWDEIQLQNRKPTLLISDWLKNHENYNQNTPWHKHSLGNHCVSVFDYVSKRTIRDSLFSDALLHAAAIHDVGKPQCRSFDKEKMLCHFYKHENVGAYRTFEYAYPEHVNPLDVSIMVNLHMKPRFFKDEGIKSRKEWGDALYSAISLLNQGDEMTNDISITPENFRRATEWFSETERERIVHSGRSDDYDEKELF